MIAVGIDPGMTVVNPLGVAVVLRERGAMQLIATHTLKPAKGVTGIAAQIGVFLQLSDLLRMYVIGVMGIEAAHHSLNQQTAARLSEVVGGCIAIGAQLSYSPQIMLIQPTQAKAALTGSGSADKAAMIAAVRREFGESVVKDAADAVGVAIAALVQIEQAKR